MKKSGKKVEQNFNTISRPEIQIKVKMTSGFFTH